MPLQLGCGVKGGAEIAVGIARATLQRPTRWVVMSEDKTNGFNAISRRAIYEGLRCWCPELIPTFRKFYARRGGLYTVGPGGKRLAVDADGEPYWSAEGCSQGDPLGPFFFAIGYHASLLATQAAHPDVTIICYLDDTYYWAEPSEAHAALLTGEAESTRRCGVRSNRGKQEVYGGAGADLTGLPATLRGAPSSPPSKDYEPTVGSFGSEGYVPAKGYAGGLLLCTKVLGSFIGDRLACSKRLQARVTEALKNLGKVGRLRDTRSCNVSMQVQLEILRFCANTSLVYFMRTMGPEATAEAAALHDGLITQALHVVVGTGMATPGQRSRAERQARLPAKMGGCGIVGQSPIRDAACVGSWALIWRPMQQLCPQLFGGVDLGTAPEQVFCELRRAHARLLEEHDRISRVYDLWDANYYDYDKDGEGHTQYHPSGLAKNKELLPLSRFGTEDEYLQSAQRRYSSVVNHGAWLKHLTQCQSISRREAVRFMCVSQPNAGTFLNAVPKLKGFRMPTWALRLQMQRRLGLPLLAATAAAGRRSRHGRLFDSLGDVAAADGESGHQTRHFLINKAIYDALRRVYGGQARREPDNYYGYSNHRPDIALLVEGNLTALDLKVFDPLGSEPAKADERGAYVGFGKSATRRRRLTRTCLGGWSAWATAGTTAAPAWAPLLR